jgi:hypothetical protein
MNAIVTKSQLLIYIKNGLNKAAIAKKIGITEYQVSRLLHEAKLRVKRRRTPPPYIYIDDTTEEKAESKSTKKPLAKEVKVVNVLPSKSGSYEIHHHYLTT